MTELLATWTAQTWKTPATTYYLDGHRKAVFTTTSLHADSLGEPAKSCGAERSFCSMIPTVTRASSLLGAGQPSDSGNHIGVEALRGDAESHI